MTGAKPLPAGGSASGGRPWMGSARRGDAAGSQAE